MKNYYDEDEDNENLAPMNRRPVEQETLKAVDHLIALTLGAFVFLAISLFPFPGLIPESWNDVAVAAGLRPPAAIFPAFWDMMVRGLFSAFGVSKGLVAVKLAGRVCVSCSAVLVYLLFRTCLTLTIRSRLRYASRRNFVIRGAAALGTLFFVCSDPVWRAGQTFTSAGFLTLLGVFGTYLFVAFLLNGRLSNSYWSMLVLGLLSAETPAGPLFLAALWGMYVVALRHDTVAVGLPLLNPVVAQSSKWYLTVFYMFGFLVGVCADCTAFILNSGLAASGLEGGDMPILWGGHYWGQLIHAATDIGWVLALFVSVLPFVVSLVMLPRAVDEEQFLPYHTGVLFVATGLLAFSQLAELPPLWFWNWIRSADVIMSPFLLHLLVLFSSATVVFGLAVFGVDAVCRNHRRLAMQRFAFDGDDESASDAASAGTADDEPEPSRRGFVFLGVAGLLMVAATVPGRMQVETRRMLGIIDDYAREVLSECGPCEWLFTDGSFDAQLELLAADRGRKLRALSMMAGSSPRDIWIRQKGVTDMEDRMVLSMGAPTTLRTWMRDKPDRMKNAAIQLGFELWKRDGKEVPMCSGVLARPIGMSDEDCAKGVMAAQKLADRILEMYVEGGPSRSAGRLVNELFLFVQWRISRLARMRAERADRAGDTESAMRDVKLSDTLDQSNASLQQILKNMEKARSQALKQVTPREGLQLALVRADFVLARRYAESILTVEPDDPNANFGLGMSYYTQGQWARSEEYLRRCLVRKPKEPAVWNNLAMICMYTGRFDEALANAKKALEIIPESAEVKDTIKKIERARGEAEKGTLENTLKKLEKARRDMEQGIARERIKGKAEQGEHQGKTDGR